MTTEVLPVSSAKLNDARSHLLGALENHLYDEIKFYVNQVSNVDLEEREALQECLLEDLVNLHMEFRDV